MNRKQPHSPLKLSARAASTLVLAVSILPLGAVPAVAQEQSMVDQVAEAAAQIKEQGFSTLGTQAYNWREGSGAIGLQASYPAKYDLRDEGVVTPVKFQNPWGTCWGFSAIAASETSILSELKAAGADYSASSPFYDLSERQLAWFAYSPIPEGDDSGQGGEGMVAVTDDENSLFNNGGLPVFATSIFSSGIGPLTEEDAPYRNDEGIIDYQTDEEGNKVLDENGDPIPLWYAMEGTWKLDESLRFKQAIGLEQTFILPVPATFKEVYNEESDAYDTVYEYNGEATDAIKDQLMQGRAVSIAFCADQSLPGQPSAEQFLNPDTWAHYTYSPMQANHAVTIVGWDDTYSKDNFTEGHQPPADGAWIAKNSWGAADNEFPNKNGWGIDGNGYFYLSYYDQSLVTAETFDYNTASIGTRDAYYANQYDYMPSSAAFSETSEDKLSAANIFTAEDDQLVTTLTAKTTAPNTTVTYELYLLNDGYTSPTDGKKVAEVTETYQYGGFHRAELSGNQQLAVPAGASFSVVVTQRVADEYTCSIEAGNSKKAIDEYNDAMRELLIMFTIDSVFEEHPEWDPENEEDYQKAYDEAAEIVDAMIELGIITQVTTYNKGVVNEGESFMYTDGAWADETDIINRLEAADEGLYTYDNFAIKAYAEELESPFEDVSAGDWYYSAVDYANTNGIMTGYGNDTFGVGDPLTREQLARIVANAVDGVATDPDAAKDMPDADKVSDWAVDNVAWAIENGVINGVETENGREIKPQGEVTCAQMATVMMNAIEGGILQQK